MDVKAWLRDLGFGQYAGIFVDNDIDAELLAALTNEDLKELGVTSFGHRKKLLAAIAARSETLDEQAETSGASGGAVPSPNRAERRQLTVMFCDLVGSTELSRRLDPEDLRDVMRRYQDAVAGAVARYEGHVAKFLGDGVLAYFGWPQAYEDQAERAVRAGLDATAAVGDLRFGGGEPLHARVGIATGLVVVGDLVGDVTSDVEAVTGETPNLAARLQGVAEPGQVVIGGTTRRLVGHVYELDELGPQTLKGFSEAVFAWGVVGESTAESRFEAVHEGAFAHLIGREHELGLLCERWELAKGGEGQVVLLSGEAGIGKSRMVQALRNEIGDEPHFRLRYQCSPHHTNSAFHPVIQRLERAAGFSNEGSGGAKLDKLEALLKPTAEDVEAITPLFAALLSLPGEDRYGHLDLTPQQLRDRTIEALIDQVLALSRLRPVLFVVEDAHWIDPSTQDLVGEIMARVADQAVFMLITHRPEGKPLWPDYPHLTLVALNRLGRRQATEIVNAVGGQDLAHDAVDRIIARADGVPLYVEELTKSVLEAGGHDADTTAEAKVPMTLQSSLIARLDHLGEAKKTAQIGAVIGRSFSHELISAVADISATELIGALNRIVNSELVFRQGTPPEATYIFKHALVQDTAYSTLLLSRRSELHARIARTLENRFTNTAETRPELLAYHYTEAGLGKEAIPFWRRAGRCAAERSAVPEAIAHLTKGLELLEDLPAVPERDEMELSLKVLLGPALISAKGFASEDAQRTLSRARELCEQVGDNEGLFPVLFGLWIGNNSRGAVTTAKRIAADLMRSTEGVEDSGQRLQAYHCQWTSEFFSGDPDACYHHTGLGEQIYDVDAHHMHKFLYGAHDPGVCASMFRCMSGWLLGHADQAVRHANDAIALGEKLDHPRSLAMALYYAAAIHYFRGEPKIAAERADTAIAICAEHGIPASGTLILRDRARVELGDRKVAVAEISTTMQTLRSGGSTVIWPWFLALEAETDANVGRVREGLEKIDEALAYAERTGERWIDGDLRRIKGELLLTESAGNTAVAAAAFETAIEVARAQSARSIELRAATRLARLWAEGGKKGKATDLLLPVYNGFSEGFGTRDLIAAKTLLNELN